MSSNHKGPIVNPGICRCCGALKKCRLLNVEYEWLGRKEIYSEAFVDTFGLLLSHLDGVSEERLICATCVSRLREASCFRQQVLQCEERLLNSKIHVHDDEIVLEGKNKSDEDSNLIQQCKTLHLENNIELPDKETSEAIETEGVKKIKRRRTGNGIRDKITLDIKTRSKLTRLSTKDPNERMPKESYENDQAFWNIVTIVENSYVCPFSNFFNIYYCVYCRQKFRDPSNLREHTSAHVPSFEHILNSGLCRKNKKIQLDLHRIDCRLCDQKIDDIDSFKRHITIHGKAVHPVADRFLQFRLAQTMKCTECGVTFQYFHALKKHMAQHFGDYICDVCGVHYFEERMLVAHQKTHQPSGSRYVCRQCGKSFKMKYNLRIHTARLHTKEAVYMCSRCDETFFSNTLRHKHMAVAHGEESMFRCEHCEKVYDSVKTLRDHNRRIHLKLFKHQCNLCEKRFYLPCRLKEHMSSHTGERNFRCEHCGKSYPRLRALKVHMQSHSNEKKYKCTLCSASYSQNVCLKNHIKRQHQSTASEDGFTVLT